MKLITWNIWKGKHLGKIIELLKRENADVVCLQEVIERDGENSAKTIAEALGFHFVFCKSFTTDRHTPTFDIGNAVLSKVPINNSSCHFLSKLDAYQGSSVTEPRTAIKLTLMINNRPLTVISTHLGYTEGFRDSDLRLTQLENLIQLVENENCILVGDFNSLPHSSVISKLSSTLQPVDKNAEQISYTDMRKPDKPTYRIDYMFVTDDLRFGDFRIIESDASDHFPLVVELNL